MLKKTEKNILIMTVRNDECSGDNYLITVL